MLSNYKNSELILNNQLPIAGQRIDTKILNLMKSKYYLPDFNDINNTSIEFHLYSNDGGYLIGNHNVTDWKQTYNQDTKLDEVQFDIHSNISSYGFIRGNYKFVYNFHKNLIGSFNSANKLFIADVSPSRRELKLKLSDIQDVKLLQEFNNFIDNVNVNTDYWKSYVLNFGYNKLINILNISTDRQEREIYVRLYEELPGDVTINTFCFLSTEIMESYVDKITLIPTEVIKRGNNLKGPNFFIENDYAVNQDTEFKNYEYLIASGSSSQQLIESLFNKDLLTGIRINVDYSEFNNFVHFSSAEERVDNFVYKLRQIELYDARLSDLSIVVGDKAGEYGKVTNIKKNIINTFDDFEKYLYFGYSASLYTYPGTASVEPYPKVVPSGVIYGPLPWNQMYMQWQQATSSWVDYYGFFTSSIELVYPYSLEPTDSDNAITWYERTKDVARTYDKFNLNALRWYLPGHIVDDSLNEGAVLFMDMLGQHYDIIWTYIKNIRSLYSSEEHVRDGTSPDLLYNLAKHYGWTLTNGRQTNELWEAFFGVDKDNVKIQSGSLGIQSINSDIATKQIWKRIINNLPSILKTKGSNRSVKAIISSYGIPSSILYTKEYGGPSTTKLRSDLTLNKFQYSLVLNDSSSIQIPFKKIDNAYQDTIFVRSFNYNANLVDYTTNGRDKQLFLSKNDVNNNNLFHISVDYDYNTYHSERANLRFYYKSASVYLTSSITDLDLLDGDFYNVALQRMTSSLSNNINNEYRLYVAKEKYGKVTIFRSASIYTTTSSNELNVLWNTSGSIKFFNDVNITQYNPFFGSVREIRFWTNPLDEDVLIQHTKAGGSYVGNSTTSSFYDLEMRYIFGNNKRDYSTNQTLYSHHPNQQLLKFDDGFALAATVTGITNEYFGYNQDSTYRVPSIGGQNFLSTKIRIENDIQISNLNMTNRSTLADYDDQPLDSAKLVIAFSPQDTINEDIISHIGDANLDDYIGNPADVYRDEYPNLQEFSIEYWKKYENRNDFNAFFKLVQLYDFGVFEQIRQVLPYRANKILGTLVEQNLLERNRVKTNTLPEINDVHITQKDGTQILIEELKTDDYNNYKPGNIETLNIYKLNSEAPDIDLDTAVDRLDSFQLNGKTIELNDSFSGNVLSLNGYNYDKSTLLNNKKDLPSVYRFYNSKKVAGNWIVQSNSKDRYSPFGTLVDKFPTNSINSIRKYYYNNIDSASLYKFYSSSVEKSIYDSAKSLPTSTQRNRYKGCVSDIYPIDGTPSVEVFSVDPNTILFTGENNLRDGSLEII